MKIKQFKNKILALFSVILSFVLITPVFASSFSVAPLGIAVKEGDVINVVVMADGEGTQNYTFKSTINFSPELLSVTDWQWSDNWIPITFDEYNSIDNLEGVIVRTAGYPGGITNEKEFGTITFVAKKSGYANFSIDGSNSFVLNIDGENTLN